MIRAFVRFYSSRNAKDLQGCRLLDYANTKSHLNVPRSPYLLSSRVGSRYNNLTDNYDDKLELLTILKLLATRNEPQTIKSWSRLSQRLGLDPTLRLHDIDFKTLAQAATLDDIDLFVSCIEAPTLAEALKLSSKIKKVPHFLALYILSRHPESPLDVYNATRIFETWLLQAPDHIKPELTIILIKMAQKMLVEIVPEIVQIFVDAVQDPLPRNTQQVVNEMLWQLSRFTKFWQTAEVPFITRAQEILLNKYGVDLVDTKGLMALAYVKHFDSPAIARQVLDKLVQITVFRDPPESQQSFAYCCAPLLIKMFTSATVEEALVIADQATTHKTAIWTNLVVHLSRKKLLTGDMALKLWNAVRGKRPPVRISALFTELIIGAVPNFEEKHRILKAALSDGLKLSPNLTAKMMKTTSYHDLESALNYYSEFSEHALVMEQVLETQSYVSPNNVWSTYCRLKNSTKSPSRNALQALCRAAWNPNLMWDGMYASQRALHEFKLHVRGATDGTTYDIFRLYPTNSLLYAYLVMSGRSGYHVELLNFLKWMDQLNYDVPKRLLCALIHYSPQGPALLQMTRGVSNQWPTVEEFELYQKEITFT